MGEDISTVHNDAELADALKDVEPPARPDITPVGYTVIVGAVVQFARAFGIWDASAEQEEALNSACYMLVALGLGDVALRAARNIASR